MFCSLEIRDCREISASRDPTPTIQPTPSRSIGMDFIPTLSVRVANMGHMNASTEVKGDPLSYYHYSSSISFHNRPKHSRSVLETSFVFEGC